jgi:alanine racemase
MSTNPKQRAWLEIRGRALLANHDRVRSALDPSVAILPMVKADAYGLGVREVVRALEPTEPYGFGVATVDEGVELRDLGWSGAVLVLSPQPPDAVVAGVEAGLTLSVGSPEALRSVATAADRVGRVVDVHLDVDTGMGRSGVDWRLSSRGLSNFREALTERVRLSGAFTHLHSAEDDAASVRRQADRFRTWMEALGDGGDTRFHISNSAGAFRAPPLVGNLVRPGIFLYGGQCGPDAPTPEAVVSLKARVVHVRTVDPGMTVGYGATYRAHAPERWATLALGYGDGLPRVLGNKGFALVRGTRVPIIGRISMDVTVVNITEAPGVGVGDVATLIGRDGAEEITLDQVASRAGTISYEILTGFTARLPRVWEGTNGG